LRASCFKVNIALSINSDLAAFALDTEAGDGVERGSSFGLASAQAESRMVPRATNGFAHHQSFRQGTTVMCAGRADSECILSLPDKNDRLTINVTQQGRILHQTFKVNAGFEIWSLKFLRAVICQAENPPPSSILSIAKSQDRR
jgi:hypothetical protein